MYDADKDIDVALMQKCLMCSFLSRDILGKEDYQIIKDLGLKPRGKNAWAEFKIYEPGLYPWFINASQCRFMTHILRQALIVSQEVKDDKSRLELGLKNNKPHLLARILIDGIWTETKIQADSYSPQFTSFHFTDEFKIRKLAKVKPSIKIEADAFFMPTPVMEEPRPFYPKTCILLEKSSGAPIYCETLRSLESDGQKVLDGLYSFVEQTGKKPAVIYVSKEEMCFLLLDTCKQVGIEIQMVKELEMAEGFKANMFNHFG